MHRRGHVLVLSGWWGHEMIDDLGMALGDLKLALPRHNGPKTATIHLLNFHLDIDSVSGAISLLRRNFLSTNVTVSVVAEGKLTGAGVIFLVAARQALTGANRKIYDSCKVEFSASNSNWSEGNRMGFDGPRTTIDQVCREVGLLGEKVVQRLNRGEAWKPSAEALLSANLVEKVIHHSP